MTLNTKSFKKIGLLLFFGLALCALVFYILIFGSSSGKNIDRQLAENSILNEIDNTQTISAADKLALKQQTQDLFSLVQRAESSISFKESAGEIGKTGVGEGEKEEPANLPSAVIGDESTEPESVTNQAVIPQTDKTVPVDIWNDPLEKVVPQPYISYLNEMKNILIGANFFDKGKEIKFEKLNDVISFWEESLDYFIAEGVIKNEERNQYLAGVRLVWPATLELEKDKLPRWQAEKSSADSFAGWGIRPIIQRLANFVFPLIRPAFASCFKVGATMPYGYNLWAPCCACTTGTPPIPIGCLNAPWLGLRNNAIWDPTNGICGIG